MAEKTEQSEFSKWVATLPRGSALERQAKKNIAAEKAAGVKAKPRGIPKPGKEKADG